jgi:hypothetical protein
LYKETREVLNLVKGINELHAVSGGGKESQKLRSAYDDLIGSINRCLNRASELTAQHVTALYTVLGAIKEPLCLYFACIPKDTHSGKRIIEMIEEAIGCTGKEAKAMFMNERSNLLRMVVTAMKKKYPDIEITEAWAENYVCKNGMKALRKEIIDALMTVVYVEVQRNSKGYVDKARLMSFTKQDRVPREWHPPVFPQYAEMEEDRRPQRECLWEDDNLRLEEVIDCREVALNGMEGAEFRNLIREGRSGRHALARMCWGHMVKDRKTDILKALSVADRELVAEWDAQNRAKRRTRASQQPHDEDNEGENTASSKTHDRRVPHRN